MISGKELFAEISNEAVLEGGEVVGYFVKNNRMDTLEQMLSRTVTVKLPKISVGDVMHMSGFSRDYAEGWCAGNDNAIHELCNTDGIKWEAE